MQVRSFRCSSCKPVCQRSCGESSHWRLIGNRSCIDYKRSFCPWKRAFLWTEWWNWWYRPENRAFSWTWRVKWQFQPEKGAFLWPRKWKTKKRHLWKDVQWNADVTKRRFSAASSASARLSEKVEAAGTPSPILLPQAAALQKPTGLFADRLRPW